MRRVGNRLPILVHPGDIGILEPEAHRLPQTRLHQPAVFPVEYLGAENLDALQGGMGVAADIFL
jgi:hypothetical protein